MMEDEQNIELLEVQNMSLDEWLSILFNPPKGKLFIDYKFPTDKHKMEYIDDIHERSEEDISKLLLKFLFPSTVMPTHDKFAFNSLLETIKSDPVKSDKYFKFQYYRRLFLFGIRKSKIPPWEGITWVLDLLPHFPKQAIEGLNAYLIAHAQQLPDSRFRSLCDAIAIIRAKFVSNPSTIPEKIQFLLGLKPREFEFLIERLYHEMNYKTQITPAVKDGGRDIIAFKKSPGKLEHLRIECKRYKGNVGISYIRGLLGVVSDEKVNKGVLITTGNFTKPSKKFAEQNSRIELIAGKQLVPLLNEYLGPSWPLHLERLLLDSHKKHNLVHQT